MAPRSLSWLTASLAVLWALLAGGVSPAAAQTVCSVIAYGNVPTAGQWINCFQQKQDLLGFTPLGLNGGTLTGRLVTAPSVIGGAGFNVPPGVAPTSPVNGDVWTTSAGMFVRINGSTVGPLNGPGGLALTTGDLFYGVGGLAAQTTPTAVFDGAFGTAQGSLITRNATVWTALAPSATVGAPLVSGGTSGNLSYGTISGNTTKFVTAFGSFTVGNCLQADSNGNAIDATIPCGGGTGGGGTVSAGTINQLAYYGATGVVVSGNSNLTYPAGAHLLAVVDAAQTFTLLQTFTRGQSGSGLTNPLPGISLGAYSQASTNCITHVDLFNVTFGLGISTNGGGQFNFCAAAGATFAFFPNGLTLASAPPVKIASDRITGTFGATLPAIWGATANYNVLSFNNSLTTGPGALGLLGGGVADPSLYVASTSSVVIRLNGLNVANFNASNMGIGGAGLGNGGIFFGGNTSGGGGLVAQSVAGTAVVSFPTGSGTMVSNAAAGLILNSISGQIAPDISTAANIWAATSNKLIDAASAAASQVEQPLTDVPGGTVAVNFNNGRLFVLPMTGSGNSRTLGNPTNVPVGGGGCIRFVQGGGTNTVVLGTNWWVANGGHASFSLSPGAGAQDLYCFYFLGSAIAYGSVAKNVAN